MICKNCGQELKENDKFCGNCGFKSEPSPFENQEVLKANVFSNSIEKIIPLEVNLNDDINNKKNPKKFKNIGISLVVVLLLFLACAFIFNSNMFYSKKGKRTIMIYMIGSDLESKYLAATKDINEIIDSKPNFNDVNIILYTGGAKKWHSNEISNDKHNLFEINNDGLKKLEEFDNNNMLDSDNLLYLLNYGFKNYDTEYYDLILWDHGAGPVYGYGYDEYNKLNSMSINDIEKALKNSSFIGDNKLELIGFDACLMSSIETATILSDYSNYMVASEEFEPGSGWNYRFFEKVDNKLSSIDFGKNIIDYFDDYYKQKDYVNGISLSLLKLNKVDNVIKYTDELFSDLDKDLSIDFSQISRTRSNSKTYGRISSEEYYYDLVDFNDLLSKMPEKYNDKVNNLKTSLTDLVIYQKTDLDNTNGISIFFPYENKKDIKDNIEKYAKIKFSDSYYKYIVDFSNRLTGNKISTWTLSDKPIKSYGEGKVSITLDKDILNNYSKADYIIFEKSKDNYFIPIFSGSDINIDNNTLSTSIERKSLVATDSEGNNMNLTAIESIKGKNYTSYHIPGIISRFDVDTLEFDVKNVYFDFVVDSGHQDGYVSGVYPMDLNENYTYSKTKIELKDWDEIQLVSYKYDILDENGNYTKEWQNNPEVTMISFSTDEEIKISFSDLDISHDYYCLFRIKDSQNNTYYSNLTSVSKK